MKVLIPALCVATPHLETELEIIEKHIEQGDDVYYLQCRGEVSSCFLYFNTNPSSCFTCQKRFENAVKLLSKKINVVHYPQIKQKEIPEIVFENVQELKDYCLDGRNYGMGVASSLISYYRNEDFDAKKSKMVIRERIEISEYIYSAMKLLFQEIKPDIVYLFNGRFFSCAPIKILCEELKLSYITHEAALDRYFLRANALPHSQKHNIEDINTLYNQYSLDEAQQIAYNHYYARKNKIGKKIIHQGLNNKKNSLPSNFDTTKKNIVFYNSSAFEFLAIKDYIFTSKCYNDEIDFLKHVVNETDKLKNIHIYFRIHPNLKNSNSTQVQQIMEYEHASPCLTIIRPEETIDSYALLENSDIVMTFMSTMGAEAAFWDKPVIILGMPEYAQFEGFYTPKNHQEVLDLLYQEKLETNPLGAIKYALWQEKRGQQFKYYISHERHLGEFKGVNLKELSQIQMVQLHFLELLDLRSPIAIIKKCKHIVFSLLAIVKKQFLNK